jgi:hypothetical protein
LEQVDRGEKSMEEDVVKAKRLKLVDDDGETRALLEEGS